MVRMRSSMLNLPNDSQLFRHRARLILSPLRVGEKLSNGTSDLIACWQADACERHRSRNLRVPKGAPPASLPGKLTSFPLLQRKLMPVVLHPIPQCHP